MKVRLFKKQTIFNAIRLHSNNANALKGWYNIISNANWNSGKDITSSYPGNLINNKRVVFDIGGNGRNSLRIICTYLFYKNEVKLYINWIGTHEEYNRLDEYKKTIVWDY
jgi:mRNA-degrading endonuclease HigB of HigAB toxin-antitoxin module